MTSLSIIIPILNEAEIIVSALSALAPLRDRGAEIIVVDGGSIDGSADLARPLADFVLAGPRGRAAQMNAGASLAHGDILLFLHADTRLPAGAGELIIGSLNHSAHWGRFDVRIESTRLLLKLVAATMNARSRFSGIATGDQGIFVRRRTFVQAGGFPDIPLMEDIALSRQLKCLSSPRCLREPVITSGRRWEKNGVLRTIFLMWRLRLAYFFGAAPAALARHYGHVRHDH